MSVIDSSDSTSPATSSTPPPQDVPVDGLVAQVAQALLIAEEQQSAAASSSTLSHQIPDVSAQVADISERLATLLTEASTHRATVDNLETSVSALATNLVEMNQNYQTLLARVTQQIEASLHASVGSCTPAYVAQAINDSFICANNALQASISNIESSLSMTNNRITQLETAVPVIPVYTAPTIGISPVSSPVPVYTHGAAAFLGSGANFSAMQ